MIIKFDLNYESKLIRVLKHDIMKSIPPIDISFDGYDAVMCCHPVCQDLWCARMIMLNIYQPDWVDRLLSIHPVDIFQMDFRKKYCTFFIENIEQWFHKVRVLFN